MRVRLNIQQSQPQSDRSVLVSLPRDEFLARHIPEMTSGRSDEMTRKGRQAEVEVEREGLDRLAWYKSFRLGGDWGIHIRRQGVVGFASHLSATSGKAVDRSIKAAFRCLYEHELFHFQVDCAYLKLETGGRLSIDEKEVFGPKSLYFTTRKAFKAWDPLEEALANAQAVRRAKPKFQDAVKAFLLKGPVGYKDFGQFVTNEAFREALDSLFNVTSQSLLREALSSGVGSLVDVEDKELNGQHVPTYLELD